MLPVKKHGNSVYCLKSRRELGLSDIESHGIQTAAKEKFKEKIKRNF
jgi:hypothetical protein